jgi:hypothetical protein
LQDKNEIVERKQVWNRVARYFTAQYIKMGKYIPNDRKVYQMAIK